MTTGHRSERTRAMVADYTAGASLGVVARDYGVSKAAISLALERCGARATPEEIARRRLIALKARKR